MRWVLDTLGVAGGGYGLNTGRPIFLRRMGFWRFEEESASIHK